MQGNDATGHSHAGGGRSPEHELVAAAVHALEDAAYATEHEVVVNPYLDARVDLVARADEGPAVVIEIRADSVTMDTVEQVQHMARLLSRHTGEDTVGLLLTGGVVSPAARRYADVCTPRVYIATAENLREVLRQITSAQAAPAR